MFHKILVATALAIETLSLSIELPQRSNYSSHLIRCGGENR